MVSINLVSVIFTTLAIGAMAKPVTASTTKAVERDSVPANTCDFKYKGLYDDYVLRGKYLDMSKFGDEGQGYLAALRENCGAVTSWKFEKGNFDGYQWQVKFKLPLGVFDCVGFAATNNGMMTHGNCVGRDVH